MGYTLSTNTTDVIATSTGTDNNLTEILEAMISAGYTQVSRVEERLYKIVGKRLSLLQASGQTTVVHWDCTLYMEDGAALFRGPGSIISAKTTNKSGVFVGYPIAIFDSQTFFYSSGTPRFNIGQAFQSSNTANTTLNAEDFTVSFILPTGLANTGANWGFLFGNNSGFSKGNYTRCRFCTTLEQASIDARHNLVIGIDDGDYSGVTIENVGAVELTAAANKLVKDLVIKNVRILKIFAGNGFLEGGSLNVVEVTPQNSKTFYLTDITPPGGIVAGAIGASAQSSGFIGDTSSAPGGGTAVVRNSLVGTAINKGSNTSSVVVIDPTNQTKYIRSLSAGGVFSGGNELGLDNSNNGDRIVAVLQQINVTAGGARDATIAVQNAGNFRYLISEYGKLPIFGTVALTGAATDPKQLLGLFADDVTVANLATAAAYTGITFAPSAVNNVLVTVSSARTKQQLYDFLQTKKADVSNSGVTLGAVNLPTSWFPNYDRLSYDIQIGTVNVTLDLQASLTGANPFRVAGTLRLGTADFSGLIGTIAATGVIEVADGSTNLERLDFESGSQINLRSGATAATVTVGAGQSSNITAGTGVTLVAPQITLSAPNVKDPIYAIGVTLLRQETFIIPDISAAIDTTTNTLTLTSNYLTIASPSSFLAFVPQSGATLPTVSGGVAIEPLGLYFVKSVSGDSVTLSLVEGGELLDFATTGAGTFVVRAWTEIDAQTVPAGSTGYSTTLDLPSGTTLLLKARGYQNEDLPATATQYLTTEVLWEASSQAIAATLNYSTNPDVVHNVITAATQYTDDGESVAGISFDFDGTLQFDFDGGGTLATQDVYAWYVWYTSTVEGRRYVGDVVEALNSANINVSPPIQFENIDFGTVLRLTGAFIRRTDGVSLTHIGPTSGVIEYDFDQLAVPYTVASGSGLDSTQSTQLTTLFNATTAGTGATAFSATALENASSDGGFGDGDRILLTDAETHARKLAKQLGLVAGVTATHADTGITVSDGDGSTTITDNGDGSYTVEGT
jgi:hypothetical protein